MEEILTYIQQYGALFYPITFVWTALEGETFVVFAAFAAQKEYLNIVYLFLAAWSGSFFGDQVAFWIGRRFGSHLLTKSPKLKPKFDRVLDILEKYAVLFIFLYRFMYGIRNVSGFAIGMSKLPWPRFVFLNFLAAGLWSFVFCGAGYLFGDAIEKMSSGQSGAVFGVREATLSVLGLVVLIVSLRFFIRYLQTRYFEIPDSIEADKAFKKTEL